MVTSHMSQGQKKTELELHLIPFLYTLLVTCDFVTCDLFRKDEPEF